MGEDKLVERDLMSQEEFKEYLDKHLEEKKKYISENPLYYVQTFEACNKYRSLGRAIKRGLISPQGVIYPKRPFNNRANTCERKGKCSRDMNDFKKSIYGNYKQK